MVRDIDKGEHRPGRRSRGGGLRRPFALSDADPTRRSSPALGLGSMYGLLALGFHVTYAVSGR